MNSFKTTPNHLMVLKSIVATNSRQSTYTLFKKVRIPIADFMQILLDLQKQEYVTLENDVVLVTNLGFSFLMKRVQDPEKKAQKDYLANVPLAMRNNQRVDIHEPYIPSKSRLHKTLLAG